MNKQTMELKILKPERVLVESRADKVIAEGPEGFFCLKPRHVDFTSALIPGILYYYQDDEEHIAAVGRGILVKCGPEVMVSVMKAVKGDDLESLEQKVQQEFRMREKSERAAGQALKSLEAELIQQFIGLEKDLDRPF